MDYKNKKILLVEDDQILASIERKQLESRGYVIHHVNSGEKAVTAVLDDAVDSDLILMDIDLGTGMDGTQAAQAILNARDIPVLFLSSHTEPEVVGKTEKITSYGYVVKNSGIVVLDASIKMALKLFEAKRERILAEDKLKENDYYLRKAQEISRLGHISYDPVSQVADCSEEFLRVFGLNTVQPRFEDLAEVLHPEDRHLFLPFLDRAVKDGIPFDEECRLQHSDGKVLFVQARAEWMKTRNGMRLVGTIQDITERKKADQELRASEEFLQESQRIANIGSFRYDLPTGLTYWSENCYRLYGYEPNEIEPSFELFKSALHPDDLRFVEEAFEELLQSPKPVHHELRIYDRQGRMKWIYNKMTPIMDNGKAVQFVGTQIDITERKRTELALRESETNFRNDPREKRDLSSSARQEGRLTDAGRNPCYPQSLERCRLPDRNDQGHQCRTGSQSAL